MRKTIAVILAALMILLTTCALAAGVQSPTRSPESVESGFTDADGVELLSIKPNGLFLDMIRYIVEACVNGGQFDILPEDIAAIIGDAREKVMEVGCWQLSGDLTDLDQIGLTFKFGSPYEEGVDVTVLFCAETDDGFDWLTIHGAVNDEQNVVVALSKEDLGLIGNKPFMAVAIEDKIC